MKVGPGRGDCQATARPPDTHEWVSFEDPDEERTWVFDVTFLLSGWQCIYGQGCQGVLTGPAPELVQGCCSYGAHFTDDDDVARVKAAAKTLTDADWQFAAAGRRGGVVRTEADGAQVTRLVEGACIFLNRPGFPGGPGLRPPPGGPRPGPGCPGAQARRVLAAPAAPGGHHRRAPATSPRRSPSGTAGTGATAGAEFHWWCTEAPEAFSGAEPVYREHGRELIAMVGRRPMYRRLVAYLQGRSARMPLPTRWCGRGPGDGPGLVAGRSGAWSQAGAGRRSGRQVRRQA